MIVDEVKIVLLDIELYEQSADTAGSPLLSAGRKYNLILRFERQRPNKTGQPQKQQVFNSLGVSLRGEAIATLDRLLQAQWLS